MKRIALIVAVLWFAVVACNFGTGEAPPEITELDAMNTQIAQTVAEIVAATQRVQPTQSIEIELTSVPPESTAIISTTSVPSYSCNWSQISQSLGGKTEPYIVGSGPVKGSSILHDWIVDILGDGLGPIYIGSSVFADQGLHYEPFVGGIIRSGEQIQWDERARAVVSYFPSDEALDAASSHWLEHCVGGITQGEDVLEEPYLASPTPTP